jgi:hypothetical protein
MWIGLSEDVAEMFAVREGCFEASEYLEPGEALLGFGEAKNLSWVRSTTREKLSDAKRRANRKALEKRRAPQRAELERRRRAYKAAKQREYAAAKKVLASNLTRC